MDRRPNSLLPQLFRSIVFALIVCLPINAAEFSETTSQIYTLLEKKQFDDAFQLATSKQSEYEGFTDFDLAFGLAAQSSGNCHIALFSLERVVQLRPQSIIGRFALGNCYLALGNYSAADSEFRLLEQTNISVALRQSVAQARASLKRRRKISEGGWFNVLQIKSGIDSNPNNGVEDEFVSVPLLGQVRLFEQSREVSSAFYDVSAQFSYFQPMTQKSMWYASIGVNRTQFFDELALSQSTLNLVAGYTRQLQEVELELRLFYRPLLLDGENFLSYFGISGQASFNVLSESRMGSAITLAKLDYAEATELTRNQTWLELWFETPIFNGINRFTLKVGNEQSELSAFDFNSRNVTGLAYQFSQQVNRQWFYSISTDYLKAEYEQSHPLFMQTRDDKLLKLALNVNYRWNKDWRLKAQLGLVENSSNTALYQYDRSSLWLGADYQF